MRYIRFHVAIAGGGPAGLATAIRLARDGLDVLVVERSDYTGLRVGEHLPPGAKPLLRALGMSDVLDGGVHAPCPGVVSAWGSSVPAEKHYLAHPEGDGVNLTRPAFDLGLVALARAAGVRVVTAARLDGLMRGAGWRVTVERDGGGFDVDAQFLIDATGRAAGIAKQLGASVIAHDALTGLVGRSEPAQVEDVTAIIEAVETGWWYSAGLADGSVVASFLCDADLHDLSGGNRGAVWRDALDRSPLTRGRCRALSQVGELHVRSARTQCLDMPAGEGWLAVGDAAMSFDPLSSEGISKGLAWARQAAETAAAWCKGDVRAVNGYRDQVAQAFADYLAQRRRYYGMERRWPQAPFWARRHRG